MKERVITSRARGALGVLTVALAACSGSEGPGPVANPCVEQPTTAIQVLDLLTTKRVQPGNIATFTFRIDARDRDGVLITAEGEVTVDGPGVILPGTGDSVSWRAGMEHGTFDVRIGRVGCPDDFILEKIVVEAPQLATLTGNQGAAPVGTGVAWSPDSRYFALAERDALRVYDTSGRYVRGIKTGILGLTQRVAWSTDGEWIAVAGDDGVNAGPVLLKADRLEPWTRFPKDNGFGVVFDGESEHLYALGLAYHPNGGILASEMVRLDLRTGAVASFEGAPGLASGAGGGAGPPPFDMHVDALGVVYAGVITHKTGNFVTLRQYGCGSDNAGRVSVPHEPSGLVYVATETALCTVNPATGETTEIAITGMRYASSLALDPLGEGLVIAGRACDGSLIDICERSVTVLRGDLNDPEGLALSTLRNRGEATSVAWSPDGAHVVVAFFDEASEVIARDALWLYWGDPFARR